MTPDANTERQQEAERRLSSDTKELRKRIERVDEGIDEAKQELASRKEDADEPQEEAGGDWEAKAPESTGGEDPSALDDPEAEEEEE